MKKTLIAVLAVALALAALCGQALAVSGDITVKETKVYSDSAMTNYVGTIPAATSVLVRAYDAYADVYINGKVCYVNPSCLLHKDVDTSYVATLTKGTELFQRADKDAKSLKLKKAGSVKLLLVDGDWALVQSTGKTGLYAFVKVSSLTDIRTK